MTTDQFATPTELLHDVTRGETHTVEFKQTFRVDSKTGAVNKALPKVVAKTVCGFLNAHGGTLWLGVSDNGEIVGLGPDINSVSSKNTDGLERTMRTSLGNYLGIEILPYVETEFLQHEGHIVARLVCGKHHQPVFLRDGDKQLFYVRSGNLTSPLDIASAHTYISGHWQPPSVLAEDRMRTVVAEAIAAAGGVAALGGPPVETAEAAALRQPHALDPTPPWLSVASRRVLQLFLDPLARAHGWERLYLVAPWFSLFEAQATMSFTQMLKRITDDATTVYVVTRPPEHTWHSKALDLLAATSRANIVLLPHLHAKLYAARTASSSFAVLGSMNFTQASLATNRELGVRVDGYAAGKPVVSHLELEAASIYRTPGREFFSRATF